MNRITLLIFVGVLLGITSPVLAADTAGVGIVKGTITLGGKPAPHAVVSIENLPKEQSVTKPLKRVLDQRNGKFLPTVMAIMVGETVDFPNNDKSWHNVHSKGGENDFDVGLYPPSKTRSKRFDKPGVARILCNAHPNMEAFIVVKDHPYFSTTDSRGNYEIKKIPLGNLRVDIWYPNLDVRSETVELVRDGEVLALNVELKKR